MLVSKYKKNYKKKDGSVIKDKVAITLIISKEDIYPSKNDKYVKVQIPADWVIGTDNKGSIRADKLINFDLLPFNTK